MTIHGHPHGMKRPPSPPGVLTQPDRSGWLGRGLFQQAWSISPRVSTRGGTDVGSASVVTGENVCPA